MKRLFLATLLLTACTPEPSVSDKLAEADRYFQEHGGEPGYRAAAYDLYREALEAPGTKQEHLRAHFGLGMIGLFDLVQGLPRLLVTDPAKEDEPSDMPPADALARTVDTLVHVAIDKGIVEHLAVVAAEKDFSFNFIHLVFPATDATQKSIDLSGEWDLAEIRIVYGAAQLVVAIEELGYSYDGLFEAVMKAALSGEPLPEIPSNPRDIPAWLVDAAKASGLEPLPWLDPAFGVLGKNDRIATVKDRLDKGFGAMADAMIYLQAEKDDQKNDVFPKSSFAKTVITKLIQSDDITLSVVGTVLAADLLQDLFARLRDSVIDPAKPFIIPQELLDYIETLLEGAYDGPSNLVELRVPALRVVKFFDNPIADLKAAKGGLLPAFDAAGEFVVESEQEPWIDENENGLAEDGEYKDTGVDGFVDNNDDGVPENTGRLGAGNNKFDQPLAFTPYGSTVTGTTLPLKHKSPAGKIDAPNGIVDPVYLFFGDASFHGLFVPIVQNVDTELYEADLDAGYTNGDLMRLTSSLVWLIQTE